jgi:excisionase family DNA binding protein
LKRRETLEDRLADEAATPIDPVDLVSDGAMTKKAAAAFTGVSESQLDRHMENGTLPYVRDGRARKIPRKALVLFMARRLVRRNDLGVLPEPKR